MSTKFKRLHFKETNVAAQVGDRVLHLNIADGTKTGTVTKVNQKSIVVEFADGLFKAPKFYCGFGVMVGRFDQLFLEQKVTPKRKAA